MKFVSNANDGNTWADQPERPLRCPDCNADAVAIAIGDRIDITHADGCPLADGIRHTANADLTWLHQHGTSRRVRDITAPERTELAARVGHPIHGTVTVVAADLGHGRYGRSFWTTEGETLGGIIVEAVAA